MSREARYLRLLASWCSWSVEEQQHLCARDLWAFDQLRLQAAHLIGFMA